MDHSTYRYKAPNADTAILLLHGICCTPRHYDWLVEQIPENYTVSNILFEGHGGSVSDFSKATMKKWKQQVEEEIQSLAAEHENIVVAGYSMGSLLALEAAQKHSEIKALLLMNVPFCPRVTLKMAWRSIRFSFGKVNENDPIDRCCINELGIKLEPWLWKYLAWIPNFFELIKLGFECRPIPAKLKIPCRAFLGGKDELVSPRSAKWLENLPNVEYTFFKDTGHFYYSDKVKETIAKSLLRLLKELT